MKDFETIDLDLSNTLAISQFSPEIQSRVFREHVRRWLVSMGVEECTDDVSDRTVSDTLQFLPKKCDKYMLLEIAKEYAILKMCYQSIDDTFDHMQVNSICDWHDVSWEAKGKRVCVSGIQSPFESLEVYDGESSALAMLVSCDSPVYDHVCSENWERLELCRTARERFECADDESQYIEIDAE